jgi:hypothetical protein
MSIESILELAERDDIKALIARRSNLPTEAPEIGSDEQFGEADALLQEMKALAKEAEELRFSITRPIDDHKKDVMQFFKTTITDALGEAVTQFERALRIYQKEQEEARRIAQAEEAEKARKQQERLDRRADSAEEKGQHEKAANLREQADAVVPVATTSAPKAKGVRASENWTFEIINEDAIPREHMIPNEKSIRGVVKAMKGKTNIPGIRVYDANSLAALKQA